MFAWDKELRSTSFKLTTFIGWILGSISFALGFYRNFDIGSVEIEAFLITCVVFAQYYSLQNFRRSPTVKHASIVFAILFWSLGFVLRRLDVILSTTYSGFVLVFVCLVVFIRSR